MQKLISVAALVAISAASQAFLPGQTNWFIGIDNQERILSGPFAAPAGQPATLSPNFNRLTIGYAHMFPENGTPNQSSNHWHRKSPYTLYRETAGGPILVDDTFRTVNAQGVATGFANFLPETPNTFIPLVPGSGAFSGQMITASNPNRQWDNMAFRPVSWLNRPGATVGEQILFNSGRSAHNNDPSAGRFNFRLNDLNAANLAIEVVSLSSGLQMFDSSGTAFGVGSQFVLGSGDFNVTPVFGINESVAVPGSILQAEIRVVDLNGNLLPSGRTVFNFQPVPEPATMTALAVGALAMLRRRKKSSN